MAYGPDFPAILHAGRRLRRSRSGGRQPRRTADPAADQVRAGDQSEDSESARPDNPADAAGARRPSHRMIDRRTLLVALAAASFGDIPKSARSSARVDESDSSPCQRVPNPSRPVDLERSCGVNARARLRRGENLIIEWRFRRWRYCHGCRNWRRSSWRSKWTSSSAEPRLSSARPRRQRALSRL